MRRLTIGVVGHGVMGRRHLANLARRPDVDLLTEGDVDAVLEQRPDAVIVATSATSHAEDVRRCVTADVHVLVEKPMVTDRNDACAVVALAARSSRVVAVGHVERFSAFAAIWPASPTITEIRTRRLSPPPTRTIDVGVLLDLAVHDVDLVRFLTGAEYLSVTLDGDSDSAVVQGRLDNGVLVTHEVSRRADAAIRHWELVDHAGDVVRVDLHSPGSATLQSELTEFIAACRGEGFGRLASSADGAAAVTVVTGGPTAASGHEL